MEFFITSTFHFKSRHHQNSTKTKYPSKFIQGIYFINDDMKTRRLLQEGRKFNEKIYIIIYLSQSTLKLFPKVGQEQKTKRNKKKNC